MEPGDTVYFNKTKMTILEIDDDGTAVCQWRDRQGKMRADLFKDEDLREATQQMDRSDFS